MKLKFTIMSLVGLAASSLIATAQNNAAAGDNNQSPATVAIASAAPATAAPAPAVTEAAPAAPAPVAPAPQQDAATNTAAATSSAMPLISMDDTLLTDAIKTLARQAGLNYMLDPKLSFIQPGPDGRVTQPSVSFRLENVTAEQALTALLNNYGLQIMEDPKTKVARITAKDPAAPPTLINKVVVLKYADPTNMVPIVQAVFTDKRSRVMADVRTSQLYVQATESEIAAIDELISRTDLQTRQVLIEARLIETSKNPTTSKGVDWTGTLQKQNIVFGNGLTTGTVTSSQGNTYGTSTGALVGQTGQPFIGTNTFGAATGNTSGNTIGSLLNSAVGNGGLSLNTAKGFFPYTAFLNADGVSAALSFLNTDADAKVLSTPRAVTLDNQEATLSVTTAQPIFLATAGTQGSPGGSQVNYTNLGTILKVTPRISANNTINLRVIPEVSDIGGTIQKTVAGVINQADFFDVRRIDTRVLIPSGNTLVMGGLVNDNSTKGNTKVPILGDIPLLGYLFTSENKTQNKKNLIIFITPTIVTDEDFQPTQTEFLKTKMNDKPMADFGAWDSGTPQDWSKLIHKKSDSDSDSTTSGLK
jgi:type II secretory pathway component GspD/PulD (secretin)